ncbi:structural maintenance of chromosomes protein [Anaeramoeba flamelloides]|uniref:Structural maintenance of chromosomes protein 5 n=1 Tax=Anaeramoeba flamelloides TaxID=1746091 RepID=A0AAV7ZEK4_9EUKA|nr:structural maintenance of chromosomes protein [Anaeramoeba flamelloides]
MSSSSDESSGESDIARKRKNNFNDSNDVKCRRNNKKKNKQKHSFSKKKEIEIEFSSQDNDEKQNEKTKRKNKKKHKQKKEKLDEQEEEEINFNLSDFDPEETKEYKIGSIKRLYMKNFMTFNECEFFPGPRLNLILGPNGSGKSSIISAIALALGAHTNVFGRQEKMNEFIKFGEDEAFIEIELFMGNNKPTATIGRRIIDNRSEWRLNGKKSTAKEIQLINKKLGIQVNNLCQFLPQDKVYEFSAISPALLLEKTESVVDPVIHEKHLFLKNNKKVQEDIELEIEKLKQDRIAVEQKNQSIKKQVQTYLKLKQLKSDLVLLEQKLVYLRYEEAKKFLQQSASELNRIREEQKRLTKIYNPILAKKKKIRLIQDRAEKKIQTAFRKVRLGKEITTRDLDNLEKLEMKSDENRNRIQTLKDRKKNTRIEIEKKTQEIDQYSQQMENFNITEIKTESKKLNHKIRQVTELQIQLQRKKLNINNEIRQKNQKFQNVKNTVLKLRDEKIRILRAFNKGGNNPVFDAYQWIQRNKSLFKKRIFGPVALEINPKDQYAANCITLHVPMEKLKTFIFQCKEDLDTFYREGFKKNNFKVACKYFIPNQRDYPRIINDEEKKKYQIDKFLDEVIEGKPIIIEYLKYYSQIHNCVVIRKKNVDIIENLLKNTPIKCIFTPEQRYLKRRTYIGTNSTMINTIARSRLYGEIKESEKELDLQRKLKRIEEKILSKRKVVEEIQNDEDEQAKIIRGLSQKKNTFNNDLKKYKNLHSKKRIVQRKIEILNKQKDSKNEINSLKKQLDKISKEREETIQNLSYKIEKYFQAVTEENFAKIEKQLLKKQEIKLNNQCNQQNFELKEINKKLFEHERIVNRLKDQCLLLIKRRKEKIPELNDDIMKDFEKLSDDSDEIAEMINILQTQISLKPNVPRAVFDQYNDREKHQNELTEKIKKKYQELHDNNNNIKETEKTWLKGIEKIIQKINRHFSTLFAELGAVGEVQLIKDPNRDYSKFELHILVKFRDETNLHILRANRQSGGERAVTTALFLMALQNLIECPFRVVDELNQGMDPQNEKTTFNLIVKFVCRPNVPQYFMVTPKLLPGLNLTKDIACHIVFNSSFIPKNPKLWFIPNIVKFGNKNNQLRRKRKTKKKKN